MPTAQAHNIEERALNVLQLFRTAWVLVKLYSAPPTKCPTHKMPHPQNAPPTRSYFHICHNGVCNTYDIFLPPSLLPSPSLFSFSLPPSLLPSLLSPSLSPPPTPQSKLFFRRWFEVVDLVVILVTTLITILYVILDEHGEEDSETGNIIIS